MTFVQGAGRAVLSNTPFWIVTDRTMELFLSIVAILPFTSRILREPAQGSTAASTGTAASKRPKQLILLTAAHFTACGREITQQVLQFAYTGSASRLPGLHFLYFRVARRLLPCLIC